jgi:hypothetical protein
MIILSTGQEPKKEKTNKKAVKCDTTTVSVRGPLLDSIQIEQNIQKKKLEDLIEEAKKKK